MALPPYDPRKALNITERQYVLPTGLHIVYATSPALDATKPVFLMLHGVSFHKEIWFPVMEELRKLGVKNTLVAVDLPGSPEALDWAKIGVDLLGLGRQLAQESGAPLCGVGHSIGSAMLVGMEIGQPGLFSQLFLFEPMIPPPWDPYGAAELKDLPPSAAALARRAQFPSAEAAYSNFKSKAVFKTWDPRTLSAYVRFGLKAQADGSCALKCVPMVEARSYMLPSTQKYWPDLPRIQTPITLIRASDTNIWLYQDNSPQSAMEHYKKQFPRAEFLTESGTHNWPMESPAQYARIVVQRLRPAKL